MNPDYLPTLRERFGDDAGRDADEPGCTLRSAQCCYCTGRAGCQAADEDDDLDADDYDPDYDLDLCGPDGAGEWYGTRRVETVEIPGVSQ